MHFRKKGRVSLSRNFSALPTTQQTFLRAVSADQDTDSTEPSRFSLFISVVKDRHGLGTGFAPIASRKKRIKGRAFMTFNTSLAAKTSVVTAASSGIVRTIAEKLGGAGAGSAVTS